jgi:GntR family transcriptional regulator
MVEEVSLPASMFPGLSVQDFASRIVLLAQRYGVLLGKAEERLSIGAASPEVAETLKIAPETPLMVLDRLVYALDGRPVEWRVGRGHFTDKYYMAEIS